MTLPSFNVQNCFITSEFLVADNRFTLPNLNIRGLGTAYYSENFWKV